MAIYKYAFQGFEKEQMARAVGRDLDISIKQAIEICNYLRHRKLSQAKSLLQRVIEKKQAVPFKRFTNGLGHRSGKMASGRYPKKASAAFLKVLESAEANAQAKGINTNEAEIIHLCAHKAHTPPHHGRTSGRDFKKAHVEVVLQEKPQKDGQKQISDKKAKRTEKTGSKETDSQSTEAKK